MTPDPTTRLVQRFARTLDTRESRQGAPLVVGSARARDGHWMPVGEHEGRLVWAVLDGAGRVRTLIGAPVTDEGNEEEK